MDIFPRSGDYTYVTDDFFIDGNNDCNYFLSIDSCKSGPGLDFALMLSNSELENTSGVYERVLKFLLEYDYAKLFRDCYIP